MAEISDDDIFILSYNRRIEEIRQLQKSLPEQPVILEEEIKQQIGQIQERFEYFVGLQDFFNPILSPNIQFMLYNVNNIVASLYYAPIRETLFYEKKKKQSQIVGSLEIEVYKNGVAEDKLFSKKLPLSYNQRPWTYFENATLHLAKKTGEASAIFSGLRESKREMEISTIASAKNEIKYLQQRTKSENE